MSRESNVQRLEKELKAACVIFAVLGAALLIAAVYFFASYEISIGIVVLLIDIAFLLFGFLLVRSTKKRIQRERRAEERARRERIEAAREEERAAVISEHKRRRPAQSTGNTYERPAAPVQPQTVADDYDAQRIARMEARERAQYATPPSRRPSAQTRNAKNRRHRKRPVRLIVILALVLLAVALVALIAWNMYQNALVEEIRQKTATIRPFNDMNYADTAGNTVSAATEAPATPTPIPTPTPLPTPTPTPNVWNRSGQYKVGTDIPAGEYVVISDDNAYVVLSSDSSGSFDSIISNANLTTQTYIAVRNGEYLTVNRGHFCAVADAPTFSTDSGNGKFKVGRDLSAGEYRATAVSDLGYIAVSSDSRGVLDSIVTNANLNDGESIYITVENGQYVELRDVILK